MRASFTQWLLQQVDRDDPVGDLAGDAARDPEWPAGGRGLSRFLVYLRNRGACEGAITALQLAWSEWKEVPSESVLS
ncbi:MAG: YozE family protein [Anaerolineae bacterium]